MTIKLLIVEDDVPQMRLYSKAVEKWNSSESKKFNIVQAENREKAFEKLNNESYDAAIIDLRLPGDAPDHSSGNDILTTIKKELRYPVYIVSGNISDLDSKFDDNPFIESFSRGDISPGDLLKKIFKRYSTGITNILGQKGRFEDALNIVFWNHIPHAISHWEEIDLLPEVKEKQLLRYTLSHLQEILSMDELGKDEKYNTAEVYIKPPIKNGISPGLVVKIDGNYFLVITPACDISQESADYFQLLKMIKLEDIPEIQKKGRSNGRMDVIKNLVKNNKNRFHYLPAFGYEEDMVVDFQNITTIDKSIDTEGIVFLCAIASPFFKDIVNRFSSYYARQGSPDFDAEALSHQLNERLHERPLN